MTDEIKSRGRPRGYRMSEESKKILRESLEGRTQYYRREIMCNGVKYNSITEAAKALGISVGTVSYRLKNWGGWYYL